MLRRHFFSYSASPPSLSALLVSRDSFFSLSPSCRLSVVGERDGKRQITLKLSPQPWPTEATIAILDLTESFSFATNRERDERTLTALRRNRFLKSTDQTFVRIGISICYTVKTKPNKLCVCESRKRERTKMRDNKNSFVRQSLNFILASKLRFPIAAWFSKVIVPGTKYHWPDIYWRNKVRNWILKT